MSEHEVDVPTTPIEVEEFLTWLARRARPIAEHARRPTGATFACTSRGSASEARRSTPSPKRTSTPTSRHLRAQGKAPSSVARVTVAVRSLHRFLADEGTARDDPAAAVETPRVPASLPKALDEDEVEQLIESVDGDEPVDRRDRAMLEVLYGTGVRISELVGLSLADVDLDGALLARVRQGSEGAHRSARTACASACSRVWYDRGRPDLEPKRWARRGDAEAVFLNARGGRLTRAGAWLVVKKYGDRVGLGDRLSPHVLRHSCATHLLDHGADIRAVQELLGHVSISTTQVYTKVTTERLWQVYEAGPSKGEQRRSRSV